MDKSTEKIEVVRHEKFIEFIFLEMSRHAVDEWYQKFLVYLDDEVAANAPTLRVMINIVQPRKFPEVSYTVQKARLVRVKYPNLPPRRYAVLGYMTALGNLLRPFLEILRLMNAQFQYFSDREKAEAWLSE